MQFAHSQSKMRALHYLYRHFVIQIDKHPPLQTMQNQVITTFNDRYRYTERNAVLYLQRHISTSEMALKEQIPQNSICHTLGQGTWLLSLSAANIFATPEHQSSHLIFQDHRRNLLSRTDSWDGTDQFGIQHSGMGIWGVIVIILPRGQTERIPEQS